MKHTDGKESRQNLATCAYFVHLLQRTYVPVSLSELIGLTLIPSVLSLQTLIGFMESFNVYIIWCCGLLYRGGLWICSDFLRGTGHPVAQLVEALRYKSEGRGFHSVWCHWTFFIDINYGREVDSASNRNKYQEYFLGVKWPVPRPDNLTTFMCRLSWNLGASTSWNPQSLSRPVMVRGTLCLIHGVRFFPTFRRNVLSTSLGDLTGYRWVPKYGPYKSRSSKPVRCENSEDHPSRTVTATKVLLICNVLRRYFQAYICALLCVEHIKDGHNYGIFCVSSSSSSTKLYCLFEWI
jgi:hypothetical protein